MFELFQVRPKELQNWELGDLLSLPRLPTRRRHGKKSLLDYSSSHVVTSNQYLTVLRQTTLEKEVVDKIREQKSKEREEKDEDGLNIHLPQWKK
jgi:hypothetical protein